MTDVSIELLADFPQYAEVIGRWHFDEWGHEDPSGTLEWWIARLAESAGRGELPTVWVALADGAPAGSIALIDFDMDIHRDVSPWLAGLFVATEFRGLGIAAELVRTCERGAAALGAASLYLQTEIPDFYARLGWREYAREHYLGDDVVVMVRDLP